MLGLMLANDAFSSVHNKIESFGQLVEINLMLFGKRIYLVLAAEFYAYTGLKLIWQQFDVS